MNAPQSMEMDQNRYTQFMDVSVFISNTTDVDHINAMANETTPYIVIVCGAFVNDVDTADANDTCG